MNESRQSPVIKRCDMGDTSVEYLHYPADAPDLLLLHATGFIPWMWHPIAEALHDRFNIIAPYLCDHRESDPDRGGLSWRLLADDLYRLCSSIGLDKPFVAGHSMGASVITLCAGLHEIEPSSMILIEPIFLPEALYSVEMTVEQHPLASKSIKRKNSWQSPDDAKSYLKSKSLFSRWDEEMLDIYIRYGMIPGENGGLSLRCSPRNEASIFMGGKAQSPWELIPGIKCPVLVVEGEISENRPFINLKDISEKFPGGSYIEVKGAGHLIPMEQPDEICRIINGFFKVSV